jgi:hypothetical protein
MTSSEQVNHGADVEHRPLELDLRALSLEHLTNCPITDGLEGWPAALIALSQSEQRGV